MTTSSLKMVIMAVAKAFAWLETQDYTRVYLINDSMSMLRKIETGLIRCQWLESIQRSNIRSVTFIFVPGHSGVEGNERADSLASSAILTAGQPMDRADIINNLRDMGRTEDFEGNVSSSLSRMRELGVKIGIARTERYSGRMKGTVKEHRTGTISRCLLMNILRGRSEHLWTCPECYNDDPDIT